VWAWRWSISVTQCHAMHNGEHGAFLQTTRTVGWCSWAPAILQMPCKARMTTASLDTFSKTICRVQGILSSLIPHINHYHVHGTHSFAVPKKHLSNYEHATLPFRVNGIKLFRGSCKLPRVDRWGAVQRAHGQETGRVGDGGRFGKTWQTDSNMGMVGN
jgi:hypothetical protein